MRTSSVNDDNSFDSNYWQGLISIAFQVGNLLGEDVSPFDYAQKLQREVDMAGMAREGTLDGISVGGIVIYFKVD